MRLKFKNGEFANAEQETLKMVLTMIMEEVRPIVMKMEEESPEVYSMILNAIKRPISLEVHAYDLHLNASVFVKNLDLLILQDAVLMQG